MKEMAIKNTSANHLCKGFILVLSVAILNRPLVVMAPGVSAVCILEPFVFMRMRTPTSYPFVCSPQNTEVVVMYEICPSNCLEVFYLTDQG